jgi:hypothetical protein
VAVQDVVTLPELAGAIGSSIDEGGSVRESASEEVRRARARVRTIEGRIRGILKVGRGAGCVALVRQGCRVRRPSFVAFWCVGGEAAETRLAVVAARPGLAAGLLPLPLPLLLVGRQMGLERCKTCSACALLPSSVACFDADQARGCSMSSCSDLL